MFLIFTFLFVLHRITVRQVEAEWPDCKISIGIYLLRTVRGASALLIRGRGHRGTN